MGLSGVPSSKSHAYVFDWNMELLYTQCSGIGPYLSLRGKSHGFSHVAAGTWGVFSSYGRDGHSELVFGQRRQHSSQVTMDTSGI